jgi:hypothetical protein
MMFRSASPPLLFLLLALSSSASAFAPQSTLRLQRQRQQQHQQQQASLVTTSAIAIPAPGKTATTDDDDSSQQQQQQLDQADQWIAQLDYEGFGREVTALGKELLQQGGPADTQHLQKMVAWRNAAALIGVATMWLPLNPLTVAALSTWTYASWTMIAHHTCHGGYNRVDAGSFNSRGFALGNVWKRGKDWLDWMMPEAWNLEHNRLHHYRLNEVTDPDLVQRNMESIRNSNDMNMPAKYAAVAALIPIWKWWYYAPNTFKELELARIKKEGKELPANFNPTDSVTVASFLGDRDHDKALQEVVSGKEFFAKVLGPFLLTRFVLLPLPFLAIPGVGPTLFGHAMMNLIAAELLTNAHAFLTIVTNHAGEDLYTFKDAVKPKSSAFYVRQIVGSANYDTGSDPVDFAHGFLNYQIEHHVWPDLSMRQYQMAAPKLKAICEKYGVPYVQESVWERLRKTVDVMVGKTTMRPFPTQYEPAKDKALNGVTWKKDDGAIDDE